MCGRVWKDTVDEDVHRLRMPPILKFTEIYTAGPPLHVQHAIRRVSRTTWMHVEVVQILVGIAAKEWHIK